MRVGGGSTTNIRIDHYIHPDNGGQLAEIALAVQRIELQVIAGGVQLTQFADDVRTELGKINQYTSDAASDINELLDKVASAPDEAERTALINELREKTAALEQVASAYPPVAPTPPEGGTGEPEVPGTTPIEEPTGETPIEGGAVPV